MKKRSIKSWGIAFLLKCGKKQNWAIDKKVELTNRKDKIISECYCTYTSRRMKFFCLQIGGTKPQYSKKFTYPALCKNGYGLLATKTFFICNSSLKCKDGNLLLLLCFKLEWLFQICINEVGNLTTFWLFYDFIYIP